MAKPADNTARGMNALEQEEARRRPTLDDLSPTSGPAPAASKHEVPTVPPPPMEYPPRESLPPAAPSPTGAAPSPQRAASATSALPPAVESAGQIRESGLRKKSNPAMGAAVIDEVVADLKKDWRSE